MYIRVTKSPRSNLSKVYLVEGYRDEAGKSKQRIIKSYGNLEELEKADPAILAKLKAEAKKLPSLSEALKSGGVLPDSLQELINANESLADLTYNHFGLNINLATANSEAVTPIQYGYFFLESLYRELGVHEFFQTKQREATYTYNLDNIVQLLTYSRFLFPASKRETLRRQGEFFTPFEIASDDVYRSLEVMSELKEEVQMVLHEKISEAYGRDCSLVFYDVTNYYFETEQEDELKKPGMSKENKKSPIVQMGLLIDQNGIPIAYKLFPGNTHDSQTLIPMLKEMKTTYGFDKLILTADKGLNSGKNLAYLVEQNHGYIVSQKIRGASKEYKEAVLDETGYLRNETDTFKIKEFFQDRKTKTEDGRSLVIKEKVICFWSKNYDDREKHKREKLEERLATYIENPAAFKASNTYGIKKYLNVEQLDEKTGELEEFRPRVTFNEEKYANDVALDGYYTIVTNCLDLPPEEVLKNYRGLWKIEESFKVIKSDLEGRPVFLRNNARVEGHFFICFLALTLSRLLEHKLDHVYSTTQLQQALRSATCQPLEKGIYLLSKQEEVFHKIEEVFGVSLDYKYVQVEKLRHYKKACIHNTI